MKLVKVSKLLDYDPVPSSRSCRSRESKRVHALRPCPPALEEEKRSRALAYWQRFTRLEDPIWFDFYCQRTGVFDERFVPHDLYYAEIDRVLNDLHRAAGVDDKMLYARLFPGVRQPRTVCFRAGGAYWAAPGQPVTEEEALALLKQEGTVIFKQPILYCGGHGVRIVDVDRNPEETLWVLRNIPEFVAQALIRQHPSTAVFHADSVNTLRLITYLRENGQAVVLSSVLRMGSGGSRVDNVSSGGCSCGLLEDGTLKETGYSAQGWPIQAHPSGVPFARHRISAYPSAAKQAAALHGFLPQFALIAWDFAVDEENQPVLIEINIGNASIDFMQFNNGPLFGPWTEEVLERVYRLPLKEG